MTPELWQRLKPLYNAALDLPVEERSRFARKACATDAECLAELNALLEADANSVEEFASPFASLSALLPSRLSVLEPGTLLAGRFRLVRHLGSGGMGDVYEAMDEQMEQGRIALKTIRPEIAGNAAALARFKDEVRLARKVSGPNVCRIHELYLQEEENAPCRAFLTMELLEGITLHERIRTASPLPLPEIRQIASQLCTALSCIHEAGIVHQDLKPRNVMLMANGQTERVVVMDFGLARAAVPFPAQATNGSGSHALVAGTPSYMAPEQFEGREVGPPTDIYALGLILYEMGTGVQPYAADTPLAAAIRRSKPPTHASAVRTDLPGTWDEVIKCCLKYEPADRYQTAGEVRAALSNRGRVVLKLGQDLRLGIPQNALIAAGVLSLLFLAGVLWLTFGRTPHRELTPDTARWYTMGMAALREGSYMKATRLLARVTERDPTYALAHAALADAWTELDFTESAQREMLLASAPNEQRGLNEMERRYIDAVRTTLVRDYSAAAQDYEAILKKLPANSKAEGYVDLGRIYEKAGRVHETLASYEEAAKLNPDDPAPFLHLGILKSRNRDAAGAARAFDQAEQLYTAESNQEGLAEVAYQRGYAANDAEDSVAANRYLAQSLAIAKQIPSVQLEVRSLAQLSSVAYNDNKDDQAIQLANQVISMARENNLEYWVTDGMVRLANAQMDKGDQAGAESSLEDALRRASDARHPRLEATASITLASLRSQQQRWNEVVRLAQQALTYFQDYGFIDLSDQALVLITRAQRSRGEYETALASGTQLLRNAERTNSGAYVLPAEESVGFTLFRLQRYPDALQHFDHALELATQLKRDTLYFQLARADLLWQLGRAEEARSVLDQLPQEARERKNIGASIALVRANMLASQGDVHSALLLAQNARATYPKSQIGSQLDSALLRSAIMSAIQLGQTNRARDDASSLPAKAEVPDAWEAAQNELTRATLLLHTGDARDARDHAQQAEAFFAQKGIAESDALCLLVEAEAAESMKDQAIADKVSKKCVDILRGLEQSWGVPAFKQYLTRSDRQETLRALERIRAAHGDSINGLLAQGS